MSQWIGDNWTLRARPKNESDPRRVLPKDADESDTDPEIRAHGYKETIKDATSIQRNNFTTGHSTSIA